MFSMLLQGSKAASVVIDANVKTIRKYAFKGSKVKTVKVKVGARKVNKTYVKKYKKIFTAKNAGKKVKVK